MKYQEVYLYRTVRPSGWGRHTAYVGRTCSPSLRHAQHMGQSRGPAQPWSDLEPRRYVLFRMRRCPLWLIRAVEYAAIKVTLPAYNIQHNRGNPRRIKPWNARAARLARDAGRRPYGARVRDVARLLPVFGVVALAVGLWVR